MVVFVVMVVIVVIVAVAAGVFQVSLMVLS